MEHSAILSTFIQLPFVIKISVLSIFEWPFHTGFTVPVFGLFVFDVHKQLWPYRAYWPQFKVSSDRIEPCIEPSIPGLQGEWFIHYTTANPIIKFHLFPMMKSPKHTVKPVYSKNSK